MTTPTEENKKPSYLQMCQEAIKVDKSRAGTSKQAILKYITETYSIEADKAKHYLTQALKKGVETGHIKMAKESGKGSNSYKIGDAAKTSKPDKEKTPKEKVPKEPKEKVAKEPKEKVAKEPKEKVAKEPKEKVAKEPKEKVAKEPKEKVAKEPKEKVAKEPKEKVAKVPKEKVAKEPKEKVVKEAKEKVAKEPTEKAVKAPKEKAADVPKEKPIKKASLKKGSAAPATDTLDTEENQVNGTAPKRKGGAAEPSVEYEEDGASPPKKTKTGSIKPKAKTAAADGKKVAWSREGEGETNSDHGDADNPSKGRSKKI